MEMWRVLTTQWLLYGYKMNQSSVRHNQSALVFDYCNHNGRIYRIRSRTHVLNILGFEKFVYKRRNIVNHITNNCIFHWHLKLNRCMRERESYLLIGSKHTRMWIILWPIIHNLQLTNWFRIIEKKEFHSIHQ